MITRKQFKKDYNTSMNKEVVIISQEDNTCKRFNTIDIVQKYFNISLSSIIDIILNKKIFQGYKIVLAKNFDLDF